MQHGLRVTVGIVSYNHERYVGQALASTLDQEDCAIVVADDASLDGTQGVIRDWYARLDVRTRERVTLLLHEENQGLPSTLNEVLEQVATPYFVYLSADDWHLPDRLSRQADAIQAGRAGLAYGDALRADEEGMIRRRSFYERHPHWASDIGTPDPFATMLLKGNWIAAPSVMFDTAVLREVGGFDEAIAYEDHDAYTRIVAARPLLFVDGLPLAVHRETASSLGGALFTPDNRRWIEGQARTELKHLGVRHDLDQQLAAKSFVRVVRAAKLGADPAWVGQALDILGPLLPGRRPVAWWRYRLVAAVRFQAGRLLGGRAR